MRLLSIKPLALCLYTALTLTSCAGSLRKLDGDEQILATSGKIAVNASASAAGQQAKFTTLVPIGKAEASTLIFAWDFGGGAPPDKSTAAEPIVTLGNSGTYNGTLHVITEHKGDILEGDYSFEYNVYPPELGIKSVAPGSAIEGQPTSFSAQLTLPTGAAATDVRYQWDIPGAQFDATANASTATPKATFPVASADPVPGSLSVWLASNPEQTQNKNFMVTVTESVVEPVSITGISPGFGFEGKPVRITPVTPNGIENLNFAWEFGLAGTPNDATAKTPDVTLYKASATPFTISVTAWRAAEPDQAVTFEFPFTVVEPELVINDVIPHYSGDRSQPQQFTADVLNEAADTVSYLWDFGNLGTVVTSGNSATVKFADSQPAGDYSYKLTIWRTNAPWRRVEKTLKVTLPDPPAS